MKTACIKKHDAMPWIQNHDHINVFHRELLTAIEAEDLQVRVVAVLEERIAKSGVVVPHKHDVCEVICITEGAVNCLCNGIWCRLNKGEVFLVPPETVHSVASANGEESVQISIFLPTIESDFPGGGFHTEFVELSDNGCYPAFCPEDVDDNK